MCQSLKIKYAFVILKPSEGNRNNIKVTQLEVLGTDKVSFRSAGRWLAVMWVFGKAIANRPPSES